MQTAGAATCGAMLRCARVDRSTVVHLAGTSQGARGAARRRRDIGRPDDAVARADPHSLGQLPSAARRLPASDLQLHVGHQGLSRLRAPAESDRAGARRRQHRSAACTSYRHIRPVIR